MVNAILLALALPLLVGCGTVFSRPVSQVTYVAGVVAGNPGELHLFRLDSSTGALTALTDSPKEIQVVNAVTPIVGVKSAGKLIVVATMNAISVYKLNIETGLFEVSPNSPYRPSVNSNPGLAIDALETSSDGRWIFVGFRGTGGNFSLMTVISFDSTTGSFSEVITKGVGIQNSNITSLWLDPSERFLLVGSSDDQGFYPMSFDASSGFAQKLQLNAFQGTAMTHLTAAGLLPSGVVLTFSTTQFMPLQLSSAGVLSNASSALAISTSNVAVRSDLSQAYIVNGAGDYSTYRVSSTTGALQFMTTSSAGVSSSRSQAQLDSSDEFLIATPASGVGFKVFRVDEVTGGLQAVSGSPFGNKAMEYPRTLRGAIRI